MSISQQNYRQQLYERFSNKIETAPHLSRKIVSFQANKEKPFYRWFKYKEGFSSNLVQQFISEYAPKKGKTLDPFAGVGSTLFAAQEYGHETYGIELLPVGTFSIQARIALNKVSIHQIKKLFDEIINQIKDDTRYTQYIHHIPITNDAFPEQTEIEINHYLTEIEKITDKNTKTALKFIVFAVLEEMSYTRKDGQYLRWDYRSKRNLSGKPFNKGNILSFHEATTAKLNDIINDLTYTNQNLLFPTINDTINAQEPITIIEDSCLNHLPQIEENHFDCIITSPPYCNRYDYTRTYALELVYLACNYNTIKKLRQDMLSCTVENKDKIALLRELYISINKLKEFEVVLSIYNNSDAIQEVNEVMQQLNKQGLLNNKNIARMVKNYFLEMCFVIYEMYRVLKKTCYCIMVNDNVRYGGEEIPIDLILSDFAEKIGFDVEKILVLPKGKGNSSQQMGLYGRTETRKCVYVWRKKMITAN